MADAGVEGVAGELDALPFQLGAGGGDVVDVKRDVTVLLRRELATILSGSQIPKQVWPTQNSKRLCSSGLSPSVSM